MQITSSPIANNCKPDLTFSIFSKFLGGGAFALLLALPTEIQGWFDGLPWTGQIETVTLSVVIPFLLILRWRFLSQRLPTLFIFVLLLLKAILFFGSPSSGLLVKVHPDLSKQNIDSLESNLKIVDNEGWVPTYATFWNDKASGIFHNHWNNKLQFPMDWVLFNSRCLRKADFCLAEIDATIEIEGALLIPEDKKFAFLGKGIKSGALSAINENGEKLVLSPSKNIKDVTKQKYQLPRDGKWRISGKLSYSGPEWSFLPVLVDKSGQVITDLGRDFFWQNYDDLQRSSSRIGFYKLISFVVDIGILIFLFLWIVFVISSMVKSQILSIPFSIFCVSAVCLPFIIAPFFAKFLKIVGLSDPVNTSCLGVSLILVGASFFIWAKWQKDGRNFQTDKIIQSVVIFFGPALLFYFSMLWWPSIGQWKNWGSGDDWVSYQSMAYNIIVNGEWLEGGEGVFTLQPLYRYFVAIYHCLFGQSSFAQSIADVWCVLGAAILIAAISIKFRVSPQIVFITSLSYLIINFIGSYRYLLGRGLIENHAMVFLLLAAWFLYYARDRGFVQIILATLFGIFAYWLRQDHLGAVAGLAFLVLEPIDGQTGGWKGYWDRFQIQWQKFVIFWGFGISSVLLLCFRNWWLGGAFFPANINHANFVGDYERANFYLLLTGNEWPQFPSISGVLVTLGVFMALISLIWRPKPFLNYPLSIGVIFVGLFAPYTLLWTGGYPPRWSVHILPLALLSLAIFTNNLPWVKSFLPRFK